MADFSSVPGCEKCEGCRNDCCFNRRDCGDTHIFNHLSKEELHFLMGNKRQIRFKPGETVLKQNTPLSHIICIRSGLAKVVSEGPKGKNLILQIVKENNIFTGGGALTNDFRHFSVMAVTDLDCCFIDTSKLFELFSINSTFSLELLKHCNNQHLKMLNTLVNLSHKYMPGRVADTLLYLKDQIFNSNPYQFVFTKQELADMSGMTKESFIRNLKELEDCGIIRQSRNSVEIVREEDLTEISKNG